MLEMGGRTETAHARVMCQWAQAPDNFRPALDKGGRAPARSAAGAWNSDCYGGTAPVRLRGFFPPVSWPHRHLHVGRAAVHATPRKGENCPPVL